MCWNVFFQPEPTRVFNHLKAAGPRFQSTFIYTEYNVKISTWSTLLFLATIGCCTLAGGSLVAQQPAKANIATEKAANEKAATEGVAKAVAAMSRMINALDFQSLEGAMTKRARSQFVSELLFTVDLYLVPLDDDEASTLSGVEKTAIKKLGEIAKKYGLDQINTNYPAEVQSEEDMFAYDTELCESLGNEDRRITIIGEVFKVLRFVEPDLNPFSGKVTETKVAKGFISVGVSNKPAGKKWANPVPDVSFDDSLFIHRFVNENGKWLWDGYDDEVMDEQMRILNNKLLTGNVKLSGESVAGKKIDLSDYRGKYVLIDFWGTWCGPCVAELPRLKLIHKALHEKGFAIVGVAGDDKETLLEFAEKMPLPWSNIVDGEMEIADEFKVNAFPTTFLIDPEGINVAKNLSGMKLLRELVTRMDLDMADFKELQSELQYKAKTKKRDAESE